MDSNIQVLSLVKTQRVMSVTALVFLTILDVSCKVQFLESTASSNARESDTDFREQFFYSVAPAAHRSHENRLVLNLALSFPVLRVFGQLVLMEALFQSNVNLTEIMLYNQDFLSHRLRQIEVS